MAPGADPLKAARNLDEAERRAGDIRILVARGLVADLVTQLARLLANRTATGPEEIKLQDVILGEIHTYMRICQSGPAALEYLSPTEQVRRVEAQSHGAREIRRVEKEHEQAAALAQIQAELDREVKAALDEEKEHNRVVVAPFSLPQAKTIL